MSILGVSQMRQLMIGLLMILAMAFFVSVPLAQKAEAATTTTKIYVDGELVKSSTQANFSYSKTLVAGCHRVKVTQKSGGKRTVRPLNFCTDQQKELTVTVRNYDIKLKLSSPQ
jgi:methionine-rich copper-binding protein CopC